VARERSRTTAYFFRSLVSTGRDFFTMSQQRLPYTVLFGKDFAMTRILIIAALACSLFAIPNAYGGNDEAACKSAVDHLFGLAMNEAEAQMAKALAEMPEDQRAQTKTMFDAHMAQVKTQMEAKKAEAVKECMEEDEDIDLGCVMKATNLQEAMACEKPAEEEAAQPVAPETTE
jgi:hypothetical protein